MPVIQPGWHDVLQLAFHDIDADEPEGPYVLMSEDDARRIVAFVEQVAPKIDVLMVHCRAGISRSAAVAKWVAEHYGLPFNHDYCLYNRHVYRLLTGTVNGPPTSATSQRKLRKATSRRHFKLKDLLAQMPNGLPRAEGWEH